MSEWTPTTDDVRDAWWLLRAQAESLSLREARVEFDRWLAARDAEVAAKALREAAFAVKAEPWENRHRAADWLNDRADKTEGKTND